MLGEADWLGEVTAVPDWLAWVAAVLAEAGPDVAAEPPAVVLGASTVLAAARAGG
jgi:hypothetical protein